VAQRKMGPQRSLLLQKHSIKREWRKGGGPRKSGKKKKKTCGLRKRKSKIISAGGMWHAGQRRVHFERGTQVKFKRNGRGGKGRWSSCHQLFGK